ncbi:low molecular weight protein-tyrosine-phosphatase [Aestuariibacter salexigens]|uniref:low molecular weight protein-tyrosine-phosphatase n=1 Tax=Aestuariibacter salexigens TaxID=226010 RepID=UPI0004224CEC|nr:low molecular weight protein-tyrosine-phosphatase [Aestuariibacter salexigens]
MADSQLSVLFVCLGNICRSPTAEAVFATKAQQRNILISADSAGTMGYHTGSPPDKRAQEVALKRGYQMKHLRCRRVQDDDFVQFDYIVAMDNANMSDLQARCPADLQHKLHLFLSFAQSDYDEVPDPYYGGRKGFELVLDLIEDASEGMLDHIVQRDKE